jgi:hypothetical protein
LFGVSLALHDKPIESFPVDENGVRILPGYRPPFKKGEFDPRRFDAKEYWSKQPPRPKVKRQSSKLVAAIRKAFYRHCNAASNEAIDVETAAKHGRLAKLFFDLHQSLYENPKRGSKPISPVTNPVAPVAPTIPSQSDVCAPLPQSGVKTVTP